MDFPEAAHQKTPNYKTTHSLFISSVSLTENYEEGILVESFIPSYKWLMGLDLQKENSKISFSS